MTTNVVFCKQAERTTMKELTSIAHKVARANEVIGEIEECRKKGKLEDHHDRELLGQYATISKLLAMANKVVRNHQVRCPDCSYESSLSDYKLIYANDSDLDAVIQCDGSYRKGGTDGDRCKISLGDKGGESIREILNFSSLPLRKIFSRAY